MIYINKSYTDNINKGENKHYEKIVESLISTGTFDEKYKMLFDANDIFTIITLALLHIRDVPSEYWIRRQEAIKRHDIAMRHALASQRGPTKEQYQEYRLHANYWKDNYKHINEISDLFGTLPTEIREQALFSYGLEMLVNMNLDEIGSFRQTTKEISAKFTAGHHIQKTQHKNAGHI